MRATITLALAMIATPAFAKPVYNAPADLQAITDLERSTPSIWTCTGEWKKAGLSGRERNIYRYFSTTIQHGSANS